jgi:glycosyltransferase involved in cell wall biosynthesis
LEEGFGLIALEALACGAPLVTSRGSAIEELVGDAAVLAGGDDAAAVAQALTIALDPGRAAELRRRGPEQAARFTWEESARQHVAAYEQAAGRSR